MLVIEVPRRKRDGGLEGVLDLPTVPTSSEFLLARGPVSLREFQDPIFVDVHVDAAALDALEVHIPDLEGGFAVEFGVVERDVDARFEGFVEFADAVGGEN